MTDYIDRQAAIDAVRGRFSMPVDNLIVEVIGALPSAEVEPVKHGKWIDPAAEDCYRCSVCEEYTNMEMPRLLYHYCPNCGAKMDR